MNKKGAKTWCFNKGATLVEITSQTDQNNLITFLDNQGFGTKATSTIWIPINDGKSEGNFKIDNTCTKKGKSQAAIDSCLDATYTNFSTDSNNINDNTKNSVYYSVSDNFYRILCQQIHHLQAQVSHKTVKHVTQSWFYAAGDATAKFICEKAKLETTPPPTTV